MNLISVLHFLFCFATIKANVTVTREEFQPLGSNLLKRYLHVLCDRDKMTVEMSFDRGRNVAMTKFISEEIRRGRICIGEANSEECCSHLNMTQKNHVASSAYNKCSIDHASLIQGYTCKAKVHFRSIDNIDSIRENIDVECVVPYMEDNDGNFRVKIKMFASKKDLDLSFKTEDAFRAKEQKPLSVRFGSNLYIAAEPILPVRDERLRTYPLKCWTAEFLRRGTDRAKRERRYFIKNGCPVSGGDFEPAVIKQNPGSGQYADWTKIILPLTKNVIPLSSDSNAHNADNITIELSLSCEMIICVGRTLSGFQDTPTCPRATFCSLSGQKLPAWVAPHLAKATKAELSNQIMILPANASELPEEDLLDEIVFPPKIDQENGCKEECLIAVASILEQREKECHTEGLPIYFCSIIAAISFCFGAAFVATLWTINIRTDPLHKIRCVEYPCPTRNMALNTGSSNSRLTCSGAFMTATLSERRQLLLDRLLS